MRNNLILLLIVLICCEAEQDSYPVKGTVRSLDEGQSRITIAHDTIQGLMMPMVMPFPVLDQNEFSRLSIGDSVHFQFVWSDTLPYARRFEIIGQGHIPEDDEFFSDEFSELQIGKYFDDVTLLTLDSNKVSLSDSDGRYRFISYIFTRCPMPNMCPAVVMKTNYLVDKFSRSDIIDFILVSFDHKYDKPSILKRTYGTSINETSNLKIWSSSGQVEDVYKLVKQSGGDFWGIEEEKIGHTLRSVLIGPDRKFLASWSGEDWNVNQVERGIKMFIK
mgnify:FL=1